MGAGTGAAAAEAQRRRRGGATAPTATNKPRQGCRGNLSDRPLARSAGFKRTEPSARWPTGCARSPRMPETRRIAGAKHSCMRAMHVREPQETTRGPGTLKLRGVCRPVLSASAAKLERSSLRTERDPVHGRCSSTKRKDHPSRRARASSKAGSRTRSQARESGRLSAHRPKTSRLKVPSPPFRHSDPSFRRPGLRFPLLGEGFERASSSSTHALGLFLRRFWVCA